jgi:hypothetical protein
VSFTTSPSPNPQGVSQVSVWSVNSVLGVMVPYPGAPGPGYTSGPFDTGPDVPDSDVPSSDWNEWSYQPTPLAQYMILPSTQDPIYLGATGYGDPVFPLRLWGDTT